MPMYVYTWKIHKEMLAISACTKGKVGRLAFHDIPLRILWMLYHMLRVLPKQRDYCSVAKSCLTLRPPGLQHARLPCPSLSPGVCLNSCPSSRWCHPTISPSVTTFSSCLQYFPISGSFPMTLCIKWPKYWCLDPEKCLNARQRTHTCRAMGCTRHCGLDRNKLQAVKLMWTTKRKTLPPEKTESENQMIATCL